jgi:putative Mg2+ transporter-C (MgtC) family protein
MMQELSLALRLVAAAVMCAVLGYERESAGKSAGLRTQMLVGVAAALYTVMAEVMSTDYAAAGQSVRTDPLRTVQAIATGIGFIGAGVIFVTRDQDHVRGLTTAASIWLAAAVGYACGAGHYILAAAATLIALVVLRLLIRFDQPDRG